MERDQALDAAVSQIERQFGKGAIMKMGEASHVDIDSVSTGALSLDLGLGIGGLPHVGLQARLMSQALRKIAGTLNRTGPICIFTNQLREKIGVMFGSPETTPGGRALKFYSSVRLDIRRIETLKEGTEAVGNRVRVKVVKNKVAPPFKQAEFDIAYGEGISWEGSVLDVALDHKLIQKSGSYFSFGETRLGQGRTNVKAFLVEHPDVTTKLLEGIQAAVPDTVVPTRKAADAAPVKLPTSADAGADDDEAARSNGASLSPVE